MSGWNNQWGNPVNYANNFGGSQEHMKLVNLMGSCIQSGSYTFGPNAQELAKTILTSLKAKSPSLAVEMGKYSEDHSKSYDVVYFSGPVEVNYSGNKYNIYIKVTLAPNFPESSPIMSVINIDPSVFAINKEYSSGILPDETFQIPLFNASQWANHRNFESVYFELQSKLSSVFPFFRSKLDVKPKPPAFYPPLINRNLNPGFGVPSYGNNPSSFGQNQMSNFGGYNQNPGNGYNSYGQYNQGQFQGGYQQQQGYNQNSHFGGNFNQGGQHSNFSGSGNQNTGASPQALSFMKDRVNELSFAYKSDIQSDKAVFSKLVSLRMNNRLQKEQDERYTVVFDYEEKSARAQQQDF